MNKFRFAAIIAGLAAVALVIFFPPAPFLSAINLVLINMPGFISTAYTGLLASLIPLTVVFAAAAGATLSFFNLAAKFFNGSKPKSDMPGEDPSIDQSLASTTNYERKPSSLTPPVIANNPTHTGANNTQQEVEVVDQDNSAASTPRHIG